MSTIIFLLGIGSSGKSTIANALLQHLRDSYHLTGFDYSVESLDKKYWPGGSHEREGFYVKKSITEHGETSELIAGTIGKAFLKKMLEDMIRQADEGNNLIIDTVPSDEEYQELLSAFKDHEILCVGIKPPVEVIIERENRRSDRRPGTAKAAYQQFYANKKFDLEIDTSQVSAEDAVESILAQLQGNKPLHK